jgi:carbonic anhydrase/acetyltransferase-like protein (isoleucine patch superfamily)
MRELLAVVLQVALFPLPWILRRPLLGVLFRTRLPRDSYIGLSLILSGSVKMGVGSRISHFTVIKGLDRLELGDHSLIGRENWVSAWPSRNRAAFWDAQGRCPELIIGEHAAITHRHVIDCTDSVRIGAFSTFAGWGCQILSHSIEVSSSRQRCAPVSIGKYCFIGTGTIFLKGAVLPDYCILSAGSVLSRAMHEQYTLYSGVPAAPARELDRNSAYFLREEGVCH